MNITATILGQTLAFALFVMFCAKFVWPPLMKAMEDRRQKIADGLSAADRAGRDLELAREKVAADLKEAKAQAAAIIDQANRRATQIVEESKAAARVEGERLIQQAQGEIDQEINRAREELRKAVAGLVVNGAEKVLGSEVDAKAHQKLLDELAAQL